jgi:mono/diheme cytochrome c family protein
MSSKTTAAACGAGMALFIACGGQTPPPESPVAQTATAAEAATPMGAEAGATFEAQAAEGQKLYAASCASCHGASGEGGDAPRLVGVSQGALPLDPPKGAKYRKQQFRTAADVAAFVVQAMPPGEPGKLTEEQYWAILAFAHGQST